MVSRLKIYKVFVDQISVESIKRNVSNNRKKENDNLYVNIKYAHSPDVFVCLIGKITLVV